METAVNGAARYRVYLRFPGVDHPEKIASSKLKTYIAPILGVL